RDTPSACAISNSTSSRAVSETASRREAAVRSASATVVIRAPLLAYRGQPLGLVLRDQRINQLNQALPGEHAFQLVQGEPDTVIGHAALREVIGADPFGSVAAADHRLACLRLCTVRFIAVFFVEARPQHGHRLRAVPVL